MTSLLNRSMFKSILGYAELPENADRTRVVIPNAVATSDELAATAQAFGVDLDKAGSTFVLSRKDNVSVYEPTIGAYMGAVAVQWGYVIQPIDGKSLDLQSEDNGFIAFVGEYALALRTPFGKKVSIVELRKAQASGNLHTLLHELRPVARPLTELTPGVEYWVTAIQADEYDGKTVYLLTVDGFGAVRGNTAIARSIAMLEPQPEDFPIKLVTGKAQKLSSGNMMVPIPVFRPSL